MSEHDSHKKTLKSAIEQAEKILEDCEDRKPSGYTLRTAWLCGQLHLLRDWMADVSPNVKTRMEGHQQGLPELASRGEEALKRSRRIRKDENAWLAYRLRLGDILDTLRYFRDNKMPAADAASAQGEGLSPCPVCGWFHDTHLVSFKAGRFGPFTFSNHGSQNELLRVIHKGMENSGGVSADETDQIYGDHIHRAFRDRHDKAYSLLIETKNRVIRIKPPPPAPTKKPAKKRQKTG